MKLAVLSDVHGNCLAVDTVLAELQREGLTQIVCLGDMIQGGPQPAETVARLRELACPVVIGNSEPARQPEFLLQSGQCGRGP